jgi:hypothetical protein
MSISVISPLLLPAPLVSELRIASVRADRSGQLLMFRLDPGEAFEQRCRIGLDGDRFRIGIGERYLPRHDLRPMGAIDDVPASEVTAAVRRLADYVHMRAETRTHWWFAVQTEAPFHVARDDDPARAASAAAGYAAGDQTPYYLYQGPDGYFRANNPPGFGTGFFSVTAAGEWALHRGEDTYPLDSAPSAACFTALTASPAVVTGRLREAVRQRRADAAVLARADLVTSPVTAVVPASRLARNKNRHLEHASRRYAR